ALGVNLVLGERLPQRLTSHGLTKTTLETDKGTQIESDVQLVCAGMTPNVDLVRDLDASLVTDRGIRVTPGCQLADSRFEHVFVIGDASDHPTPKRYKAGLLQAMHVAKQLVAQVANGGDATLEVVPFDAGSLEGMLLPLGPRQGVGQLGDGGIVGDDVMAQIKGGDYFAKGFQAIWCAHASGTDNEPATKEKTP
ncbi:hypothetical protein As57867_020206, partial [Aphanomyces stellatus]